MTSCAPKGPSTVESDTGMPEWSAYVSGTEAFMDFGDTIATGANLLETGSDFFERLNAAELENR